MQSNAGKIAIVVAAVAAAVVLFIVLGSDDDSGEPSSEPVATAENGGGGGDKAGKPQKPEEPEIPVIVIKGGQPAGGVQELEFSAGEEIRFEVDSDVAEHVHVHGYDVIQDVTPGKPVTFAFPADIEGVFEVELEDSAVQIAELTVNPG